MNIRKERKSKDGWIFNVEIKADKEWFFETDPEHNLFIYIIHGSGYFDSNQDGAISEKSAVLFYQGSQFWAKASADGLQFLLLAGKPLKEPVAWGGPIVMNTQEELDRAFYELKTNTFIK